MRLAFALLLLCPLVATAADPSPSVVRLDMYGEHGHSTGSAVLIGGGYALTAEHCRLGNDAFVTQPIKAEAFFDPVKNGVDEAQLVRVATDCDSCVSIGATPQVGDTVYGIGYPKGNYQRYQGRVTQVTPQFIYTDFQVDHGASGGGLFNEQDQLVGICSAIDPARGVTLWIHTDSLREAVSRAEFAQAASPQVGDETRVVAFVARHCEPCERLRRDVAGGLFPGFAFEFVEYDPAIGAWSDPATHAAFVAECKPTHDPLAPTIWVPGTGKYQEGYDTRPGLIGWIESVIKFVFRGPPQRIPGRFQRSTPPAASGDVSLVGEVGHLKEQLVDLKADYDHFKDVGVLGKVRAIAALKEDKAAIEASIASLRERGKEVKDDPIGAITAALIGLLSGAVHHWFGRREVTA